MTLWNKFFLKFVKITNILTYALLLHLFYFLSINDLIYAAFAS